MFGAVEFATNHLQLCGICHFCSEGEMSCVGLGCKEDTSLWHQNFGHPTSLGLSLTCVSWYKVVQEAIVITGDCIRVD